MKNPIMLASVLVVVIGVGYFFFNAEQEAANAASQPQKPVVAASKSLVTRSFKLSALPEAPFDDKKVRIQALVNKATDEYTKIIQLSGASGEEYLAYEEDWCVATEDLSEADRAYADTQMREWEISRGHMMFAGGNTLLMGLDTDLVEFPGLNAEHLVPYKEADEETLLQWADEHDKLALTTILQYENRNRFDRETKLKVAKELIILGDTADGLSQLVIDNLSNVQVAKKFGGDDPVAYLKKALALIEYGMMRQDVSNLGVFLTDAVDFEDNLEGINPALLTESDFADIRQMALDYYDKVNETRVEQGLSHFDELDEPKIANVRYARQLTDLYREYSNVLDGPIFPKNWKDTYIKKTPCVQRRLARLEFRMKRIPEIKDEIAMLEQRLN